LFYDKVKIFVKAGDGGNGCVAFRREKYVPDGGPSGGDGGRGGNVIFRVDGGMSTLIDFRYKRHYKSERGQHGMGKDMHGRAGKDLCLRIPAGTVVRNEGTGQIIADLVTEGQEFIVAHGGRGGRGNARFAGPHNKAPTIAEKGEPGEEFWLELELKLLADVGLIGVPNAGKSTLISRISAARPKIADYPFTTVVPNLGVVKVDESFSFVVADIPGLIEGAHTGAGLGHQFLRHLERTRLLVHVLDISGMQGRDPLDDFSVINRELSLYNPTLAQRPQLIAANKIDLPDAAENLSRLQDRLSGEYKIIPVSALTGEGLKTLVLCIGEMLLQIPVPQTSPEFSKVTIYKEEEPFKVAHREGIYYVEGERIEKIVAMTYLDNPQSVKRLQKIFDLMGLEKALKDAGIKAGDTVQVGKYQFIFYP
jgi:GTP-binding protein